MPKVNWKEVQDPQEFEALPAGQYKVEVETVEVGTSQKGDEQWKVTLNVLDEEYINRKIFDRLTFSEKALGHVKRFAHAIGFDVEDEDGEISAETVQDKKCIVAIEVKPYMNKSNQEKLSNPVVFGGYLTKEEAEASSNDGMIDGQPRDDSSGGVDPEEDVPF